MTSDRRAAQRPPGRGIQVIDLHRRFVHEGKTLDVINGIDVSFDAGEMVSIQGRSGAGKSTFLHVLGTLDRPTGGQILFDGEDVFRFTSTQLARFRNANIGFVFQFHHLLPEFTALENVMMPALIHRTGRGEAERQARELLEIVGLSERLSHKPGELSGGEQQRVALARALVMRPSLLLADEPTGNLDGRTGEGIHDLFVELNERLNLTIVIVTHDPRLARRMPRQLAMDRGRLVDLDELEPAAQPESAHLGGAFAAEPTAAPPAASLGERAPDDDDGGEGDGSGDEGDDDLSDEPAGSSPR